MLEDLAEAIKNEEYEQAAKLLQDLNPEQAENPWVAFYQARIAEGLGHLGEANQGYRQLMSWITNPKLLARIRRGLERLADIEKQEQAAIQSERQAELEIAKNAPDSQEFGVFVLDMVATEEKQKAAKGFAEVMQIDPYSARLQLPSRSWRLYRTGGMGELNFYTQRLRDKQIPCFSVPVNQILSLQVFPVYYLEAIGSKAELKYRLTQEETANFEFFWSEVSQRVEGLLPIFEECVDVNKNGKIEYKTEILDYAKVCDLHLPKRNIILRFCDQIYEFNEGIDLFDPNKKRELEGTTHEKWQQLMSIFQEQLPQIKVWNEFKPFAETALDFQELLKVIDPHIYFMRQEETNWDDAFHLYSSLAFFYSV